MQGMNYCVIICVFFLLFHLISVAWFLYKPISRINAYQSKFDHKEHNRPKKQNTFSVSQNVYYKNESTTLPNEKRSKSILPETNINIFDRKPDFEQRIMTWDIHQCDIDNRTSSIFISTTAWLDLRPGLEQNPCIRLFILCSQDLTNMAKSLFTFKAKSTTQNIPITLKNYNVFVTPAFTTTKLNKTIYREILLTIPIDETAAMQFPDKMLLFVKGSGNKKSKIKVKKVQAPELYRKKFFICIKPLYGNLDQQTENHLVEWFELNRLFGVEEIHIFNLSLTISKETERIFDFYVQQGILYLHQVNSPFNIDRNKQQWEECVKISKAALSQCFYENVHRFEYMISVDLDEVIMPVIHNNYYELINSVLQDNKHIPSPSAICARWGLFYLFLPADDKQSDLLLTMKYRKYIPARKLKAQIGKARNVKSFISTRFCSFPFNHNCYVGSPGNLIVIPYSKAKTNHYRANCRTSTTGSCNQNATSADYVLKYKDQLWENVQNVIGLFQN